MTIRRSRGMKTYSLYAKSRNFNKRNLRTLPGSSCDDRFANKCESLQTKYRLL
ncbi:hypothetical protein HanPSC8_Chr12g0537271 [Helianthus annuus]|nr:hypothetical protein HanPSC8_Chr12g0537271 [Helianthus annuus]